MTIPFLNRGAELSRLRRLARRPEGSLAVLYGRRRCGKSRLLLESFAPESLVYYLADDREPALQRASLAVEIAGLVPGFERSLYPDWDALFNTWFERAPRGAILALDEFPTLVTHSPELPSILQRYLDRRPAFACHLVLCGSSQRMMHGLVLDQRAPLYGRSREILKVGPLRAGWLSEALPLDPEATVEAYSLWGGVPRYWELAADYPSSEAAALDLVLDPLGVLHNEPDTLLLDDLRDTAQSASILQLIGQGCHRLSEISARLEKPATALTRPLQRLLELGLVEREHPFESQATRRSLYRLNDPFLRFWFTFVGPARSRLRALGPPGTLGDTRGHVAGIWEDLARQSVPASNLYDREWGPASRWWGPGLDRRPMDIDVVAESLDGSSLLLGSVKWEDRPDLSRAAAELSARAATFPLRKERELCLALWVRRRGRVAPGLAVLDPGATLKLLR